MLDQASMLELDERTDPQVKAAVDAALRSGRREIGASDLLVHIVLQREAKVGARFDRAMPAGYSVEQLTAVQAYLTGREDTGEPGTPRVLPSALDAMHRYNSRSGLQREGIDLFIECVVNAMPPDERAAWEPLRFEELAATARPLLHEIPQRPEQPFILPADLIPSDNLTRRARMAGDSPRFPFDQELCYSRFFQSMAQALHRQTPRHLLLVGDRGLAQSTLLTEFAWRAALGEYTFHRQARPPQTFRGSLASD